MTSAFRGRGASVRALLLALVLAGCAGDPSPAPSDAPSTVPSTASSVPPTPSDAPASASAAAPSPTPVPELSLELPDRDERIVDVTVSPSVDAEGGRIVVSVASAADTRVDDLVVRWPTELGERLFLAPFVPSEDRIREGGDPLVQQWTKWVVGPGEHGEPAGTTSLGYGPLFPGASLEIVVFVTRMSPGPAAFDLQVLADNAILTLPDGEAAELRVEIP